ncbi:peptidylprolyl isomerase [bacterium]|nr:peptidylprolyl isomerase [bacterium]
MNFFKCILVIFLIFGLVFSLSAKKITADKTFTNKKLVEINGVVIDSEQLEFGMKRAQQSYIMQRQPVPKDLKEKVLENLISKELFYQDSKKKEIKIEENLFKEHMKRLRSKYPDEKKFNQVLKDNNITVKILKEQFFKDMAVNLYVQQEIVEKIKVTDKELKEFYDSNKERFKQPDQVKASHILIKFDAKAKKEEKDKALKKIKEILAKIKKGEDFGKLAEKHSECPSGKKGGDLGFFKSGQMVKPFEKAAFSMKKGETSDVVETRFGYHIIKTTDKKVAGYSEYKEVKDWIVQRLKQPKIADKMKSLSEKLSKKAKIKKY